MVTVPYVPPALLADPNPNPRPLVLQGGRVFTGSGADILLDDRVTIEGGYITTAPPSDDAQVIDVDGMFVMPGLIDAHGHLAEQPEPDLAEGMEPLRPGAHGHLVGAVARRALAMGVTTVRDVGARGDTVLALRQALRHGAFLGPRILACGRIVSATSPGGRHFEGMYREADGVDEMRKAAREQIRRGADFVKVMVTGARSVEMENPGPAQVTRDELDALVDEVHRQGYLVAAHCEGLDGTMMAIDAGVDTIEHGFYLHQRPEYLAKMKDSHQSLVPTLSFLQDIVEGRHGAWADTLVTRGEYNVAEAAKTLQAATVGGVNIAMGFDSRPEELAAGELELMVEAGMSPAQALMAATSGSATALGLADRIGTIEPGRMADVMVVDGDPLSDIGVLTDPERIHLVVRSGWVVQSDSFFQAR